MSIGREARSEGPTRGDIHFLDFPDTGGRAIRGPHPAVVVQAARMRRSATVVVVPMTSAAKAAEFAPSFLVAVTRRESGLDRDGWVKCDQPMTLPVTALSRRAGRLNPESMGRVDAALRFVLGL